MLQKEGFNAWAKDYDEQVKHTKGYPFEGYYNLMNEIVSMLELKEVTSILDVGIGTGLLASYIQSKQPHVTITGLDFSSNMIEIAKSRVKNGVFYPCDLNEGLPKEIANIGFDYIISTYVLHHFSLEKKLELISEMKKHLNPNGKMIIGDVAFLTKEELKDCEAKYQNVLDPDEIYLVYTELKDHLVEEGISSTFIQISFCAGILIIE